MSRIIAILCFLVVIVLVGLLVFFSRHRVAFKRIFGVPPKRASQKIVNEKIAEFQEALASYDGEDILSLSKVDEDCLGFLQHTIERARELAQRYGFQVLE